LCQHFHLCRDHRLVRLRNANSPRAFRGLCLVDCRYVPARTLMDSYQIGDRRPLTSRGWKISEKIACWLARHGATPNAISIVGMVCGILAGIMFALTSGAAYPWFFWVSGAVFVQLRLLANLY